LFHEKPFKGVNGSGKHNNWSISTNTGINLLEPGRFPANNLRFLTFFIAVIRGLHKYGDVLRASIASSGNDHRLGANEAPPAIVSVFTGDFLEEVLRKFAESGLDTSAQDANPPLDLNIPNIPVGELDNTDRNRTSAFPFTGNKFEFRAVGANSTCSFAMTTLNAIMAKTLQELAADVEKEAGKGKKQDALIKVLQRYVKESIDIVFNGDGYSEEWAIEAEKRGLKNVKNSPDALELLTTDHAKSLFAETGILTPAELGARVVVFSDNYSYEIETEALLYYELSHTHILPAAYKQLHLLAETFEGLKEMGLKDEAKELRGAAEAISAHIAAVKSGADKVKHKLEEALAVEDSLERAKALVHNVVPLFAGIRAAADALELLVDDTSWTLPKYRELLFVL
jgi:glutamine synthetase